MFIYKMQSKKYILLNIYSQYHFSHYIADGKVRYEPID